MIALVFAGAVLAQAADHDALMGQAARQLGEAVDEMAFELGRCGAIYPMAQSDPDVRLAREAIANLRSQGVSDSVARVEAVAFAYGVEDRAEHPPTIARCAEDIPAAAGQVRQVAEGMDYLLRRAGL